MSKFLLKRRLIGTPWRGACARQSPVWLSASGCARRALIDPPRFSAKDPLNFGLDAQDALSPSPRRSLSLAALLASPRGLLAPPLPSSRVLQGRVVAIETAQAAPISQTPGIHRMNSTPFPEHAGLRFWTTRYGVMPGIEDDSPVTRSLALYGEWLEAELDFLSSTIEPGQTVLELGGQYAAHTLWLARAVGDRGVIHVAEARRLAFQHICASLAINRLSNVHMHAYWLGAHRGSMPAPAPLRTDGAEDEIVHAMPLDELDLPALHLIKVNVPGALADLLAGGADSLRRHRPAIYSRLGGVGQAEAEIDALKSLGYRCWSHVPYLYNATNYRRERRNLFPGCACANVMATPAESAYELPGREITPA
jgi:FkbM family methyltransferase